MTRREDIEDELAVLESYLEEAQASVGYHEEELEIAKGELEDLEAQIEDLEEQLMQLPGDEDSNDPTQLEILEAE